MEDEFATKGLGLVCGRSEMSPVMSHPPEDVPLGEAGKRQTLKTRHS